MLLSEMGHFIMRQCNHENEAWIFIDSLDSGLSIDNICELKDFFENIMLPTKPSQLNLYVIIAANSYEFAKSSDCLDIQTSKHIHFKTYDEYANHIMITSQRKAEWQEQN